jgi:hypothetical protein
MERDEEGFTARMQKAFNVCLASESAKTLQDEAGKLKDVMDGMKKKTAEDYRGAVKGSFSTASLLTQS